MFLSYHQTLIISTSDVKGNAVWHKTENQMLHSLHSQIIKIAYVDLLFFLCYV